jgi:hypothetical protein
MKTKIFRIPFLLLACAAVNVTNAIEPDGIDSNAAFARLKTLVGEWRAETGTGKAHVAYELIAGGNTLLERETIEKMPPMLTVYHLDGDRLLLTHYCMLDNQPRMQARAFNRESGELRFEFLDVTNLKEADAGHMHNATLRFVDENHFVSEWDFYENGRRKSTETFKYTRIR